MQLGFLHLSKKQYSDLTPLLFDNFDYKETTEKFTIKENHRFQTHIDIKLRIHYYLLSYLRRTERENKNPTLEDITFNIMPLLKNGITPENQTILKVLEDIGEHVGEDRWRLKKSGQIKMWD